MLKLQAHFLTSHSRLHPHDSHMLKETQLLVFRKNNNKNRNSNHAKI